MRKQVGCHWIHNGEAGVSYVGHKIVLRVIKLNALAQEGREVSGAHCLGEHAGGGDAARVFAYTFVVAEEEKLIFQDGAAKSSPKNALRIVGLWGNRDIVVIAPAVGVQFVILQQAVGGSVVTIGSRFQDRDHGAAVGVSVRGRSVGGDYAYFGDRIGGGIIRDQVILRFIQIGAF